MQRIENNRVTIEYLIYCLLVLLPLYRDSFLQRYLGIYGATLIPIVLVICYLFRLILNRRIFCFNRFISYLLYLGIYLLFISLIANCIYITITKSSVVLGVNVFQKALNVTVQYFTFVLYANLILLLLKNYSISRGLTPFVVGSILLIVIGIIESIGGSSILSFLHYTDPDYNRIRLLAAESSHTVLLIIIYFTFAIYYAYKKRSVLLQIVLALGLVYLIYISSSKSLYLVLILYIVLFLAYLIKHGRIKEALYILIPIAIIGFLVLDAMLSSFMQDITMFTSTVTRTYTCMIGFLIGVIVPIGVGGGIYGAVLQKNLLRYIDLVKDISPSLNISEIMTLATSNSDTAVAVKSGIFQYNIYWGILGTIFITIILVGVYKSFSKEFKGAFLIKAAFIIATILIFFAMDFCFEYFLFVAMMIGLKQTKNKQTVRQANDCQYSLKRCTE